MIGAVIGSAIVGAVASKKAAEGQQAAAQTQATASEAGIAEQRRQFDALAELMSPFISAGEAGLEGQQALIGLGGPEAQQEAISGLEASPLFGALVGQGEEAILQNAAATGGLRGGNTQAALAQFRPQILSQLIESQYGKLGGLSQLGQASAAGQASAGLQTGTNIANLLSQQGAALAGGQIARGNQFGSIAGGALSGAGAGSQLGGLF